MRAWLHHGLQDYIERRPEQMDAQNRLLAEVQRRLQLGKAACPRQ